MGAAFAVSLALDPSDGAAAALGATKKCRVVVLNKDKFPAGETRLLEPVPVIAAFLKHNFNLFRRQALWGLFFKLGPAFTFVVNLILTRLLLQLLALEAKRSKARAAEFKNTLYILCACMLAK